MTTQEKFEESYGRLHKGLDNLCRAIGAGTAAPTETQIDGLVTAIDACTATADTLAMPPVAKAKPAAKRTRGRRT